SSHLRSLLGKAIGANLYEHAYSVPNAITIMPSCSTAAWASIMTGRPPADTGVAGDEFFVREENRFYAPIPLSSRDPRDFVTAIDDDLIGRILKVPTIYQRIRGSSDDAFVRLSWRHELLDTWRSCVASGGRRNCRRYADWRHIARVGRWAYRPRIKR